jgi:predicted esterase
MKSFFLILCLCLWPFYAAGILPSVLVLQPGEVHDTVICIENPEQTYALYLPRDYNGSGLWPLVMVFEPAARGKLAADTFRMAGETMGAIIMCSNNSSNQSHQRSLNAASAMLKDARARFQVDSSRIFVSGFSGGARFASGWAARDPQIRGVIACGAGLYHFRKTYPVLPKGLEYYCIIGQRDMNIPEMGETEERLLKDGIRHHIQYTDGGHVWPNAEEITTALAWLLMGGEQEDPRAEEYFRKMQEEAVRTMIARECYLDAYVRLASLSGANSDPEWDRMRKEVQAEKGYKKQSKQRERAMEQGARLQKEYLDALTDYVYATKVRPDTVHTEQWWNAEINKLIKWRDHGKLESSRLASRLLYLLEVHFQEDIQVYLGKFQRDKAIFLADLWLKIGPDKLWSLWNIAGVYSQTGRYSDAISLIETMLRMEGVEYEWFLNAPEFEPLRQEPAFLRLAQKA